MSSQNPSAVLPPPPVFKPTIIQMKGGINNNNNTTTNGGGGAIPQSNILTTLSSHESGSQEYNRTPSNSPMLRKNDPSMSPQLNPMSKKRRKSSQQLDSDELAKKRKELKIAHSIIEKKRRIKMNREFEALKYLVPACRTSIVQSMIQPPQPSPMLAAQNSQRNNSLTSDSGNSENGGQMHKLTILQSTVEYISYLHHIIQLQQNEIVTKYDPNWGTLNELGFTNFELDLDDIRDIDKNFDFNELFQKLIANNLQPLKFNQINKELKLDDRLGAEEEDKIDVELKNMSRSSSASSTSSQLNVQLPSPLVTPNIDTNALTTNLNKYKLNQFPPSSNSSNLSYNQSTSNSNPNSNSNNNSGEFQLPLPMISTKKKPASFTMSPLMTSTTASQAQSQTPKNFKFIDDEGADEDTADEQDTDTRENEASKVLLSIKDGKNKKNSISKLLN